MCFQDILSRVKERLTAAFLSQKTTPGFSHSYQSPHSALLAPYSPSAGSTSKNDVLDKNTFLWGDQAGKETHVLEIWPDLEHPVDVTWTAGEEEVDRREVQLEEGKFSEKQSGYSPHGPLRLYDCENMILKDRRTYLKETQGAVPPYIAVSQIWGQIKEHMTLPTIPWPVPISEIEKWNAVQAYCKKERVKWLWMDIICINQSSGIEPETEKANEIPKMSHYYRDATACLVVPQNYDIFCSAYSTIMKILFSIADTGASVRDYTELIWDAIASLEIVLDDAWFWGVWTYQELLLPKKHILLDGQELSIDALERCLSWYLRISRLGLLKKPSGGREYRWISQDGAGLKIADSKQWEKLKVGWDLRATFQQQGYLELLPAVMAVSSKRCRFPVDHVLGVYGLLKEEDRLPMLHEPDMHDAFSGTNGSADKKSSDGVASGVPPNNPSSPRQIARLEQLWQRTMIKTLAGGRVWPLLHDAMVADAPKGTNWMPRIVGVAGSEVHEVRNQRNQRGVAVSGAGVHLTVRVVGRISGMSASIGDGTGELDKMIACAWTLVAKRFNPQPILELLDSGLGLADSDAMSPEDIKAAQTQLRRALHAPSLARCFSKVEKMNLRPKLVHARGIAGGNRRVFAARPGPRYSSAAGTYVFLGWIFHAKIPDLNQCWILDVTAGSPDTSRWVIANKTGPNTFHKIGSVAANSLPVFTTNHVYGRVILD